MRSLSLSMVHRAADGASRLGNLRGLRLHHDLEPIPLAVADDELDQYADGTNRHRYAAVSGRHDLERGHGGRGNYFASFAANHCAGAETVGQRVDNGGSERLRRFR